MRGEKADNAVIRSKLLKARSAGTSIKGRFYDFFSDFEKIERSLKKLDDEKRDIVETLKAKQAELAEIKIEEVQEWEARKSSCNEARSKSEQNIGACKQKTEQCDKNLMGIDLKLKRSVAEDVRINKPTQYQEYADQLIRLCKSKLDAYEDECKKIIREKVNKTLQDFSRKDFQVQVSDDFSFHLIREDGHKVAKSKGEIYCSICPLYLR